MRPVLYSLIQIIEVVSKGGHVNSPNAGSQISTEETLVYPSPENRDGWD